MANQPPMHRRLIALGAGAAAAAGLLTAAAGGGKAQAAPSDPYLSRTGTSVLSSDVIPGLARLSATGTLAASTTVSLGVTLARPDPAGENAYLADVYNPKSPDFRQFLTPAQLQVQFGVSAARYAAALQWLHANGLQTTAVPNSTEYVLASGSAADVSRAFSVQLKTYRFGAETLFANTAAPTVPADLGVLDVAGLETFTHMATSQQIESTVKPTQTSGPAVPSRVLQASPNIGSTTPQDLWSIYDQPTDNMGQGESMAIFGFGCAEPTDGLACATAKIDLVGALRKDELTYGLPQIPIIITHYGQPGETISDTSGVGEWELDMPASTGMAPDADFEHLYFGYNGGDPDILAAYNAWNADPNGPRQGSSSFAGCEASPVTGSAPGGPGNPPQGPAGTIYGNPNQDAYEATLKETVELGHTMFNSAGDLGANGCPTDVNIALNGVTPSPFALNNYPSSSTYVTTVGGTVLYWTGDGDSGATPAQRFFEYAWPYTGGGTSLFIAAPTWQTGAFETDATSAPGVTFPCLTNWEATPTPYPPGTMCRGLPDVAAQSGDIISNGYFAGGGTSLSSPLWLGMWTRIQAASPNPGRLGFATPAIYANNASATNYEKDFFDIGGNIETYNGDAVNPDTIAYCQSGGIPAHDCSNSGWDYLSGWGTPDVTNLMLSLDGGTAPVAAQPANGVPEAPAAAPLALLGLGAAALALGRRRRRTT